MRQTYKTNIAGLERELPICKVTDDLYIGAFICFGDAEITVACARELLKLVPQADYDYMLTAEAKSIPLIHEMARQSGAKRYFIARKGPKAYMPDPIYVEDRSITTAGSQRLYLSRDDAELIRGKRVLLMDDVISTGGSMHAMEALVELAGGATAGRIAVFAEGDAQARSDIRYLAPLPLFNPDGTVKC
ncbi:phosphoribosyltransferase family protein [Oscillibacter sp. GMB15532]|uniref:phosphoribosyltransferase family protein n=1 Tax=Oscillibacter sp. GMB15532 TaxID=3230022 RepID=UPI0034E01DBA